MGFYPEPDCHIRNNFKVELNLSNYATENELERTTSVDTSGLAAKKIIALQAEVDKLDITKLVNIPTSLNNLKTKVDVCQLKTVPIKISKWCSEECAFVLFTKFNTLKTKVNNSEKKILEPSTLIHINQCNTNKQNLEKKNVDKKVPDTSGLVTTTVLNTKTSGLVTKTLVKLKRK